MLKKTVPIKGMHCRSCEILIAEKLKTIPGVSNVHVSWKKKQAIIHADKPVNDDKIKQAVFDAGYSVGLDQGKRWISNDPEVYYYLVFYAIVLFFIYRVATALGFTGISTSTGNPSSLLVVLLVGLTAGISTCMALVGGLVLGISARHSEKHPEATPAEKFRPHLFFNIGRVIGYAVLGGVIGLAGQAFQFSGPTLGILTVIVGLVMLTLGLQLVEIFPRLSSGSFTLPPVISRFLGIKKTHEKEYSHLNSAITGALTFFLPCGFTQAMQLYAVSTGSFVQGFLIMGIFALGTAPGLLGIGGLTSFLKGTLAKRFFAFTGVVVILLGLFNISNGYNLTGLKKPAFLERSTTSNSDSAVKIVNGVQEVRMTQVNSGYNPNRFTIQKDIPVKWIIDSKASGSCSSSIFMNKYKIRKLLTAGENIIEFTPTETGEVKFTCSMGMYSGKFIVVEQDKTVSLASSPQASPTQAQSVAPSPSPTPSPESPSQTPVGTDNQSKVETQNQNDIQEIKTTYASLEQDITPQAFTVTAGKPVRMEIDVQVDGRGCMSTILIPGIINQPELLTKGQKIVWEFTPKAGTYDITCAMGVPRGLLTAV